MISNWKEVERWLMGSASIDSLASKHMSVLCDAIGVRWGGSGGERLAAEYIHSQFNEFNLHDPCIEAFSMDSWEASSSGISIVNEQERSIDARASLFCPSINTKASLVNVGYGMDHEVHQVRDDLKGAVALISSGYEPFSTPESLTVRLERLVSLGVVAVITPCGIAGRHTAHGHAGDWRDESPNTVPLPLIHTSREDGALLARRADSGVKVAVSVVAKTFSRKSCNVVGDLLGDRWPNEWLILGAHHDTTLDSPGANDNASGATVVLETARLLTNLQREFGIAPGCSIRFVTFGSEEQGLQGANAYVNRHYGKDPKPRLMINLDELATGSMKGVALQFSQLRQMIQNTLDAMGEGLRCNVLAQMDASGDMFPFARRGIPSGMLWRSRFVGRHSDVAFGHSSSDTLDKVRIRELKEYSGLLSRLLLRLSQVSPNGWPTQELNTVEIEKRIKQERGSVIRTM